MQPGDGYSVPRRAMDVEDYIDILRRHKGWIFGPFLATLVASVVGVYFYPDSYLSQAVVKIVPQQVPQNMVQSAINQLMSDRINSMAQEIMSRTVLTTIINTGDLYKRERSRMPVEDVIELMKKNIQITPVVNPATSGGPADRIPAFAVQFSYENRIVAQRVVQDLVSRFIDANIRNRSNAVYQTTQFMKDELDQAKKQLDETENKLAAFRMQNNGRLPDQVDGNMRQLSALEAQVSYLNATINRSSQEKMQFESNARIYKDQMTVEARDPSSTTPIAKSERLVEAEREVITWESQLSALRQKYKETYPDVQNAVARLAGARKKKDDITIEEAALRGSGEAPKNPQVVREQRDLDANIKRFENAAQARDIEIANAQKELKRVNEAMRGYQSRIETIPMGEKEYADLLRDRELAKEKYVDLNGKLEKAQIAQEMEGRKQGETLELLDPPSLPTSPTEPKRPVVIGAGAFLGLLIGCVIASARELRDTSLKNLKDVRAYTQMAILGSVPLLENDFVVRRRRRMTWLGWTTASVAAAVVMSASVVYYYVKKV